MPDASWRNLASTYTPVSYGPGPYLKCTLLQEYVCYIFLEQCTFEIWSWCIFILKYSSRLLIVQDHMVLTISQGQCLQKVSGTLNYSALSISIVKESVGHDTLTSNDIATLVGIPQCNLYS